MVIAFATDFQGFARGPLECTGVFGKAKTAKDPARAEKKDTCVPRSLGRSARPAGGGGFPSLESFPRSPLN